MGKTRDTVSVGPPSVTPPLASCLILTGVSTNDQITAASGQSHYVVYGVANGDKSNANAVIATGTIGPNNRLWAENTTIDVLQFNAPYAFPEYSGRQMSTS